MSRSMCAHALTNQGYSLCDRRLEMKAKIFHRPYHCTQGGVRSPAAESVLQLITAGLPSVCTTIAAGPAGGVLRG